MNQKIKTIILAIMDLDQTIPPGERKMIELSLNFPKNKGRQINTKEAMQILQISAPSLRKLVRDGALKQIAISSQKKRYYLAEVEELAEVGRLGVFLKRK